MPGPKMAKPGELAARPLHVALLLGPESAEVYGTCLKYLCIALLDEGTRVSVVADDRLDLSDLAVGPVDVYALPRQWPLSSKRTLVDAGGKLKSTHCEVLHVMTESALPWVPALQEVEAWPVLGTLTRTTPAAWLDRGGSAAELSALLPGVLESLARPAAAVLAQWHAGRVERAIPLVERWVALSDPIAHAHAAMQINVIPPGTLPASAPACFSASSHHPGLLTVSPLEPGSGVDVLLDCLHRLHQEHVEFYSFICGTGSAERQLRAQCKRLNLLGRVTFAPSIPDWRRTLGAMDVYVEPSPARQLRSDLFEALSAGMACVCAAGSAEDCIRDGENGLLVSPGDAEALYRAIRRVLTDRDLAVQLAQAGLASVRERYAASRMALTLIGEYLVLSDRHTFTLKG